MLLGILILLLGTSLIDYTETDRVARSGLELIELQYESASSLEKSNASAALWATLTTTYKNGIEVDELGGDTNRRLLFLSVGQDSGRDPALQLVPDTTDAAAVNKYDSLLARRRAMEIDVITTKSGNSTARVDMKPMYDITTRTPSS